MNELVIEPANGNADHDLLKYHNVHSVLQPYAHQKKSHLCKYDNIVLCTDECVKDDS